MAQHVLGVDLGAHAVKAVLLESSYRGFSVVDHASAAVPPPEGEVPAPLRDRQAAALRALLAERGWRFDVAVASLPGATSAAQVVTLPFTDTRRIEQTIPFEVEGQIPFDLSEVAWDWQPIATRDGKSDLLVDVARKDEVAGVLAALAGAGVDPRVVVPAAPAYASLFSSGVVEAGPAPDPGAPARAEAVVDLGQDRANVCIVEGGACVAARTFAFGASHDARTIARELRATTRAWQARVGPRRLERVHLAGGLGNVAGLAELLAPDVDGPVEPLRLAGAAVEKLPLDGAGAFALPLALAIRGHEGAKAPRLNLRRGELAYTRDFQHVKG
ncbi:MAG TPA: pilus assembly protein PilM, partial [Anaeromyxobacteraceae bacterium]|nr:pilus assembly protein PilM [Anaeromyxobacteraceae bacterium]